MKTGSRERPLRLRLGRDGRPHQNAVVRQLVRHLAPLQRVHRRRRGVRPAIAAHLLQPVRRRVARVALRVRAAELAQVEGVLGAGGAVDGEGRADEVAREGARLHAVDDGLQEGDAGRDDGDVHLQLGGDGAGEAVAGGLQHRVARADESQAEDCQGDYASRLLISNRPGSLLWVFCLHKSCCESGHDC